MIRRGKKICEEWNYLQGNSSGRTLTINKTFEIQNCSFRKLQKLFGPPKHTKCNLHFFWCGGGLRLRFLAPTPERLQLRWRLEFLHFFRNELAGKGYREPIIFVRLETRTRTGFPHWPGLGDVLTTTVEPLYRLSTDEISRHVSCCKTFCVGSDGYG